MGCICGKRKISNDKIFKQLPEVVSVPCLENKEFPFTNIVIEGAATNGTPLLGIYKVMYDLGLTKKITNYAGTSSGSLFATFMSANIPPNDLIKEFIDLDLDSFKDDDFGIIRDVGRFLFNGFGLYKGDTYEKWIDFILCKYTKEKNITFKKLYDLTGNTLAINAVNLTTSQQEIYSYESTPDMTVCNAVRRSSSIPLIFDVEINKEGNVIVDGGVGNNFMLNHFDGSTANIKTIGFKIMDKKFESRTKLIKTKLDFKIDSPVDLLWGIIQYQTLQIERSKVDKNYWKRTVSVTSPGRSITEFKVENKIEEVISGMNDASQALVKWCNDGHFGKK